MDFIEGGDVVVVPLEEGGSGAATLNGAGVRAARRDR